MSGLTFSSSLKTGMTIERSIRSSVKIGELRETSVAFFDIVHSNAGQPFDAKIFHRKRSHDSAIDDRATDTLLSQVPGASQLPEKASGKRIAGAGRIEHFFQWISRGSKNR